MDVRCPSCGTDYELDDARVPDTGLPVKCSKCGHVFRAMRPVTPPAGEPARVVTGVHSIAPEWIIRRMSGEMIRFRELTTLQRWIVERKVNRNDEISKTGKKWEKLGNIPELAVFFQVVEGQPPSPTGPVDTPPPPPMPTNPGMPAYQPPPVQELRPTGPDPFSETLPDPSGVYKMPPRVSEEPSVPKPVPNVPMGEAEEHRHATVRWDLSRGMPDDVRESYEVSGRRPAPGFGPGPGPSAMADDFDQIDERPGRDELMPRRFSPMQIFLGLVLLVGACGALAYVLHPGWVKGLYRRYVSGTPTEAVRAVDDGYAALDKDNAQAISEAIGKFEYAIGADQDYAAAHAGLAEALVTQAELERDDGEARATALAANPVEKPDEPLHAIADARRASREHLERATAEAHRAMELDDAALTSNRAMLDVMYLTGDKERQEAYSLQAHTVSPNDARLSMIMGAIALRDGALEQAKSLLDAAALADAKVEHVAYLQARLAAKMNPGAAPSVPPAPTPSPTPPTEPVAENRDPSTGIRDPGPEKPSPEKPLAEKPTTEKPAPEKPSPDPVSSGPKLPDDPSLTFSEAINRGAWLRDHDKPGQALKYYERAAIINTSDPDGHLGVGWCNLDMHQSTPAIAAFKKAIDLSPRFSDAHFGLAEAFRSRGNKLYAIREYKTYLDIAPHGPDADVARTQLERLDNDNTQVNPGDVPAQSGGPTQQPPPPPPPQGMQ